MGCAVAADPHVAGGDAGDRAAVVEERLGGGEAGEDLDAQRLGLGRQPAADIAERGDVGAVVAHQRRQQEVRQAHRTGRPQPQEAVRG